MLVGERVANLRVRVGSGFDKSDPGRVRVGYHIWLPGIGYPRVIYGSGSGIEFINILNTKRTLLNFFTVFLLSKF